MLDDVEQELHRLVKMLVKRVPMRLPLYRFDGTEVKTADDVVALLNIPRSEAEYRLANRRDFPTRRNQKDISSGDAGHVMPVGVGTVLERAAAIAYRRRRRLRKRGNTK